MQSTTDRKLRVFLCHASQDKLVVRELYQRLLAEGWIDPWLDEEKLLPGQDWDTEIEKAVESSDAIIVCLSNKSVSKEGYVQKELKSALNTALFIPEESIFIVPIRLDECPIPRSLRAIQFTDFFPSSRKNWAYQRMQQSLRIRLDQILNVEDDQLSSKDPPSMHLEPPRGNTENDPSRVTWGGTEFCRIPRGKFQMGTNESYRLWLFPFFDLASYEHPQHTVDIPYEYWMSRFPVTNEQYSSCIGALGKNHPVEDWKAKKDYPVILITWDDAMFYCKHLNKRFGSTLPYGFVFRLPTESEWEKAARGTDGRIYPWGNQYEKNRLNTKRGEAEAVTPVSLFSPVGDSPYGCADMLGNVEQWVHSIFKSYPYRPGDGREDEEPSEQRVLRGGYFRSMDMDRSPRCTDRRERKSDDLKYSQRLGFRIVVAPPISEIVSGKISSNLLD